MRTFSKELAFCGVSRLAALLGPMAVVVAGGCNNDSSPPAASPGGTGASAGSGTSSTGGGGGASGTAGRSGNAGTGGSSAAGSGGVASGSAGKGGAAATGGGAGTSAAGTGGGAGTGAAGGGAGGGCSHSHCVVGGPLDPTCDPAVARICDPTMGSGFLDTYCCTQGWDLTCIDDIVGDSKGCPAFVEEQTTLPVSNVKIVYVTDDNEGGCGIDTQGRVWCWGGPGTYANAANDKHAPVVYFPRKIPGITNAVEVADSNAGACALDTAGDVTCWGVFFGASDPSPPTKMLSGVKHLRARGGPMCALKNDGTIWCWGQMQSGSGLLPAMFAASSPTPAAVGLATGATDLGVGHDQACAVEADTSVTCWGGIEQSSGNWMASMTTLSNCLPATWNKTQGQDCGNRLMGVTQVSVAPSHSCAVTSGGAVTCVGVNAYGELDGAPSMDMPPWKVTTISLPSAATQVVVGLLSGQDGGISCALLQTGDVMCWGYDAGGSTGTVPPTAMPSAVAPAKVLGVSNVKQIAGSATSGVDTGFSMLALTNDGKVLTWGVAAPPGYTNMGIGSVTFGKDHPTGLPTTEMWFVE